MWGFFFLIFSAMTMPAARAAVLTEAWGQVGPYVVTSREVRMSYALEQASRVSSAKSLNKIVWPKTDSEEILGQHLNQVMTEQLLKAEAEAFSFTKVQTEEIHKQALELEALLKDVPYWKELEPKPSETELILSRRKIANQFLKFKMESAGVVVSDADAKDYFEKNKSKFAGEDFAKYQDTIKQVLSEKQLEEKLRDWFDLLKRKHRVRFLFSHDERRTS